MTGDLISRTALIDSLYEHEFQIYCPLDDVSTVIDAEPAVDAEPVRHGEWIYQDDDIMPWQTCSLCRCESFDLDGARYCPYCGAKMDLEDE